ncbi:hypothetical protein U1Q18_039708 [Sarracenia purpurea var. burkii]
MVQRLTKEQRATSTSVSDDRICARGNLSTDELEALIEGIWISDELRSEAQLRCASKLQADWFTEKVQKKGFKRLEVNSASGFRCLATMVFGKLQNHGRIGISRRRKKSRVDEAGESDGEASSASGEALTKKADTWHRMEWSDGECNGGSGFDYRRRRCWFPIWVVIRCGRVVWNSCIKRNQWNLSYF